MHTQPSEPTKAIWEPAQQEQATELTAASRDTVPAAAVTGITSQPSAAAIRLISMTGPVSATRTGELRHLHPHNR